MAKAETLQLNTWVYLNRGGSSWPRRLKAHWREISLLSLALFGAVWFRYDQQVALADKVDGVKVLSESTPASTQPAIEMPQVQTTTLRLPADTKSPAGSVVIKPGNKRNGYAFGHCTYYVAGKRAVPSGWGNARTWYVNAQRAGYHVDTKPLPGAIAWTPLGYFGHVAYVEQVSGTQVLVSEMNYYGTRGGGWNRISQRWVPVSEFKYIY